MAAGGLREGLADERDREEEPAKGVASPLDVVSWCRRAEELTNTYGIRMFPGPGQAIVDSTDSNCGRWRIRHGCG